MSRTANRLVRIDDREPHGLSMIELGDFLCTKATSKDRTLIKIMISALLVLFLPTLSILAVPTADPASAVEQVDKTYTGDIPKNERIYLFGPNDVYNKRDDINHDIWGKPAIRVFSIRETGDVKTLWLPVKRNPKAVWILSIYRDGKWDGDDYRSLSTQDRPLKAGDIVFIRRARMVQI